MTLSTGHVRASVCLPAGLDTTAARAAAPMLPGGWHLEETVGGPGPAAAEITIGQARVTAGEHTVRIGLPPATAASPGLAYVTYTALERARQQQGKATVHAAAVAPGGQAVLLLGDKGSGKTGTAAELAARGWVHAGDDLVVIGEGPGGRLTVWPGRPVAAVRDPAAPLAPKTPVTLEPFASGPAPVTRVLRLAVRPGLPAAVTPAVPLTLNESLRLHELLARYISGLPTPLAGAGTVPYGPVWPVDTPALARWRSRLITLLAACGLSYLHAPGPADAATLIAREAPQ